MEQKRKWAIPLSESDLAEILGRMVRWARAGSAEPQELPRGRVLELDDWREICGEAIAGWVRTKQRVLELERELVAARAAHNIAVQVGSSTDAAVAPLGRAIGFGRLMQLTAEEWRRTNKHSGSEFAIGPCASATEPCLDCTRSGCDWCAGCGWVTHEVRRVQGLVRDRMIEGAADVLADERSGLRVAK